MSDQLLLGTRKGLLALARKNGGWAVARTDFPGIAVTLCCAIRATARFTRHSSTDTLVRSCTARTMAAALKELAAPAFAADTPGAPTLFQV